MHGIKRHTACSPTTVRSIAKPGGSGRIGWVLATTDIYLADKYAPPEHLSPYRGSSARLTSVAKFAEYHVADN